MIAAVFLSIDVVKILAIFQKPRVAHPLWLEAVGSAVAGGAASVPGVAQPLWLAVEATTTVVVVIVVVSVGGRCRVSSELCFLFFLLVFVIIVWVGGEASFFGKGCAVIDIVLWLGNIGNRVVVLREVFVCGLFEFGVVRSGGGGGGGGRRVLAGLVTVEAVAVLIFREETGVLLLLVGVQSFFFDRDSDVVCGARDFVEELTVPCMSMQRG